MPGRPTWLSWSYAHSTIPDNIFADDDQWDNMMDWFNAAPYLTPNQQNIKSYGAVKLWTLGIGMILRNLLLIARKAKEITPINKPRHLRAWTGTSMTVHISRHTYSLTVIKRTSDLLKQQYRSPSIPDAPLAQDLDIDIEDLNSYSDNGCEPVTATDLIQPLSDNEYREMPLHDLDDTNPPMDDENTAMS